MEASSESSPPKISGLIFKELIKRGYSLDGKTRIWDISDSKLWYLTPEQAQAYLDLIVTDEYKKRSSDYEKKLIKDSMEEFVQKIGEGPVNLIDLGCGDGLKALSFIEALSKKTKVRYCPVDISSYMVSKAFKNIRELGNADEVVEFKWNISDFDNIENISTALRVGGFRKNVFLLLGGTLGNFEFHDLTYNIRSGMKSEDVLIIGQKLGEEIEDSDEGGSIPKEQNKFFDYILTQLGLEPGEFELRRRVRNHRAENYYIIKKDHEIDFKGRQIKLFEGDQIITGVSYYHSYKTFKEYLEIYFSDYIIKTDEDKNYSLTLCKK